MLANTDYQALEDLLDGIQLEIRSSGVAATLKSLKVRAPEIKQQLAEHHLTDIQRYAGLFESRLRYLALLCLQQLSAPEPAEFSLVLIHACLQAGLFQEALELVDSLSETDPAVAPLAIQACYRLGLWAKLWRHAEPLADGALSTGLQLMVARAQLQLGQTTAAVARLAPLQPHTAQEQRQHQILQLLARQRSGLLNRTDTEHFLSLFPYCNAAERAALACLWPSIEAMLSPAEREAPTLHAALTHFWHGLFKTSVLVDGQTVLPPIVSRQTLSRVAIVVADPAQLVVCQEILLLLKQNTNDITEVLLVLLHPEDKPFAASVPCLDLHGLSIAGMLHQLRRQHLDVVVDTVGLLDSRWLEVLVQRIAPLQIGWVCPDLASTQSPLYDAVIVDRWTHPPEQRHLQTRLLLLSGLATISHPSALLQPGVGDQAPAAEPLLVVILGAPDQQLPGAAALLSQLLNSDPQLAIGFLDPAWAEPGLLELWWATAEQGPLPTQFRRLPGIEALATVDPRGIVGLSINQRSPTDIALQLFSLGIPIACLATNLQGSKPMAALMEALGLQAFVTDDPQQCLAIIQALAENPDLRTELRALLPSQLMQSLAMDAGPFASDLSNALLLLKDTLQGVLLQTR